MCRGSLELLLPAKSSAKSSRDKTQMRVAKILQMPSEKEGSKHKDLKYIAKLYFQFYFARVFFFCFLIEEDFFLCNFRIIFFDIIIYNSTSGTQN